MSRLRWVRTSERISPAECRATANAAQEGKVCFRKQSGRSLQQTPLVSPCPHGVIATLRLVNLVDTGDDSSHACSDLLTGKPFCRPQCEPRAKTTGLSSENSVDFEGPCINNRAGADMGSNHNSHLQSPDQRSRDFSMWCIVF